SVLTYDNYRTAERIRRYEHALADTNLDRSDLPFRIVRGMAFKRTLRSESTAQVALVHPK
ncbi:MAG: hypothetical protein IJH04_04545, partial [Eggerthellaceae bacterium]|nr:hypothetical protein [Eggerthellaceae bacterium]